MDFFEFYGNTFDFENVGIRLNPPGYFNKVSISMQTWAYLPIH
jgi:non-canonical poly(A) RNA polymerase PAPD5/7